jgi:hypothetical protein
MGRIRNTLVTAAIGAALAAQSAPAQTPPVQPTTVSGAPPGAPLDTGITQTGSITGPIQTGGSLTAPSIKPPAPKQPKTHKPAATHHGGTPAKEPGNRPKTSQAPAQTDTTPSTLPVPNSLLNVPSVTPPAHRRR